MDEMQIIEVTNKLDTIITMLETVISRISSGTGAPKKKRAPSKYNLHIKECMGNNSGKTMKECAATYVKE